MMRRLNLGCGLQPIAGWVNTDRVKLPGVDIVHDLDTAPWPWDDASVDEISAIDVFEHVDDPLIFMNQAARVLKPGGILRMRTPHWQNINSFSDPTHRRHPTEQTWDYWIAGTQFHEKYGPAYCDEGVAFEKVKIELEAGNLVVVLRRL